MKQHSLLGDHLQPLQASFAIILLIIHSRVEVATPSLNKMVAECRDHRRQALGKDFINVLNQGGFWYVWVWEEKEEIEGGEEERERGREEEGCEREEREREREVSTH